jgi:hypothetical protein
MASAARKPTPVRTRLAQVCAAFALLAQGIADLGGDFGRVPEPKRQPDRRVPQPMSF